MILIAKTLFYLVSVGVAFYWGKNWESLNSVSDIGVAYDKAKAKVEEVKANVMAEVDKLEARVENLKSKL